MNENDHPLVYHALHRRPMKGGCLPLFFLLSCALLAAVLMVVRVEMPRGQRNKGEGRVYYRNDELMRFHVRQRSPLPLNLPDDVDPARQEEAATQALPVRYEPAPLAAPPQRVFAAAPDSCVLEADSLLALPPDGLQEPDAPPAATVAPEDGKGMQP